MVSQLLFVLLLLAAVLFFARNVGKIRRNIRLGRPVTRTDHRQQRWQNVLLIAIGQSKMARRWLPGILHVMIYTGFIIVNIEVLEIVLDGLLGTHRILAKPLGPLYNGIVATAELFMFLVVVATVGFLLRRDVKHLQRFKGVEMKRWNALDANIILWTELVLMVALITMNASDQVLQSRGLAEFAQAGSFPFTSLFVPIFTPLSTPMLEVLERGAWWFHILGILTFLNYIPYSKHFHIFAAFPNVYYSNTHLLPLGRLPNNEQVTQEVELMLQGDPYAAPPEPQATETAHQRFGAKDVMDLSRPDLLSAYSCTECGRCTSVCPANITGKLLSPRKIMMDTRDRLEEVGKNLDVNSGKFKDDSKALLGSYITPEEIWACTTCNACAMACPVNINPLAIIVQLRQYLVMEESKAPDQLNNMFNNVQNAGTPWAFAATDRFNWAQNITLPAGPPATTPLTSPPAATDHSA